MTEKRRSSICFCDAFLFSGLLPTLAPATLSALLKKHGYETRIFYPSIAFFVENQLYRDAVLTRLVDDIPLQFHELLFADDDQDLFLQKIRAATVLCDADEAHLCQLRRRAEQIIPVLADQIVRQRPLMVCYSLTFGGYQFAGRLFAALKERDPHLTIVVGGSNCTPSFAEKLRRQLPQIDHVLCDETGESLLLLADALRQGRPSDVDCIVPCKGTEATMRKLQNMDALPCPDFDDYFALLKSLRVDPQFVTLPYEMARGCWWAEKRPCTMCGFFGAHPGYGAKSAEKVVAELTALSERYGVSRFRFSDLVQPRTDRIEALLPLRERGFRLFWELRPDLTESDMAALRQVGLTFGQVGLESLCTPALQWMCKGTTVLQNISVLIHASTHKIDLVWNFLYGLPGETPAWYDGVTALIPLLYHLQPPIPRKMWINRYSPLFDAKNAPGEAVDEALRDVFRWNGDDDMGSAHAGLLDAIAQWATAYRARAALYIMIDDAFTGVVRAKEGQEELFPMTREEMAVYLYYRSPHTSDEGAKKLHIEKAAIEHILDRFARQGLTAMVDGEYLSLATAHSPYRWTRSEEQVLYLGERLFLND